MSAALQILPPDRKQLLGHASLLTERNLDQKAADPGHLYLHITSPSPAVGLSGTRQQRPRITSRRTPRDIRARAALSAVADLKPGRYELVCNLKRHYRAGMYTELDVAELDVG